jgi:hypothetical protein
VDQPDLTIIGVVPGGRAESWTQVAGHKVIRELPANGLDDRQTVVQT